MGFSNSPKQTEAALLITKNYTTLLEGGARSGKTMKVLQVIDRRAKKYPGTKHLIVRFHFNDVKRSIWYDSFPKLYSLLKDKDTGQPMSEIVEENKSDWFIRLPNGSEIWIGGLDDKERSEKILGQEYATIFLNEASQISFGSYEILRTRLNPPIGVPGKFIIDYNPPPVGHWGYKMFHERVLPDGTPVPANDFAWIKMNPVDNPYLSPDYIEKNLKTLSVAKRKRFLEGDYADEIGALWKRGWIKYKKSDAALLRKVFIGVDPSGSKGGDEIGIVVVGSTGQDFFILEDCSMHGTPKEWSDAVVSAYERWKANVIVAEKNFGGDMVESTITDMGRRKLPVKLISASKAKILRAEPVSAMYEGGNVYHTQEFTELENEMCSYTGADNEKSPNRLDAAVFALLGVSEYKASFYDSL